MFLPQFIRLRMMTVRVVTNYIQRKSERNVFGLLSHYSLVAFREPTAISRQIEFETSDFWNTESAA